MAARVLGVSAVVRSITAWSTIAAGYCRLKKGAHCNDSGAKIIGSDTDRDFKKGNGSLQISQINTRNKSF